MNSTARNYTHSISMVKIVKKDGIVSTYFRRVRTMKLNSVFDTLNFNTSCSEPGVLN